MPTYQYACRECDHSFEQVQSFTEDSLTECPRCEGNLRKLFNAVGVVFKGSGFYRNDSRPTSSSTDGSSSGSESASEKKTEKKGATSEKKSESTSTSASSTSSSTASAAAAP